MATGAVAAIISALALRPARTWAALREACAGLAIAVTTFVVLLGYQLRDQLFGPHRAAELEYRNYAARPEQWIHPTSRIAMHPNAADHVLPRGFGVQETTAYVIIPMIVLTVVAVVVARRRLSVHVAALTMLAGLVLTLGSPTGRAGRITLLPR